MPRSHGLRSSILEPISYWDRDRPSPMLLKKVLKAAAQSLVSGRSGAAPGRSSDSSPGSSIEYPLEIEEKLNRAHGRAPIDRHLEILFRDERVGAENYAELFR